MMMIRMIDDEVDGEDDEEAGCKGSAEPRGAQISTGAVFFALRWGYLSANLVLR